MTKANAETFSLTYFPLLEKEVNDWRKGREDTHTHKINK